MGYVRRAQSSGKGSYKTRRPVGGKRRPSIVARTYRRKSASAQASQIRSLARLAVKNSRILNSQRTFTDYEYQGRTSGDWTAGTWQVFSLMDPVFWKQTMRLNSDADKAQVAYVRNMVFQWVVNLNTLLRSTAVTLYIVSIQPQAVDFVPSATTMVDGQNYDQCNALMPRLNPNYFKVRYCKSFNLMSNTYGGVSITASATDATGDPQTTFRRGVVNMKIGANLRSKSNKLTPSIEPRAWSDMTDEQLPGRERLYFMMYHSSADTSNFPAGQFHALFTAVTSN